MEDKIGKIIVFILFIICFYLFVKSCFLTREDMEKFKKQNQWVSDDFMGEANSTFLYNMMKLASKSFFLWKMGMVLFFLFSVIFIGFVIFSGFFS